MKIVDALKGIEVSEGFSLNINGNPPVGGCMVSFASHECTFDSVPSVDEILDFVDEYSAVLSTNDGVYIGGWLDADSGRYFLDISENIQNQAQALKLAQEW